MPLQEFTCPNGHTSEVLFSNAAAGGFYAAAGERIEYAEIPQAITCRTLRCKQIAVADVARVGYMKMTYGSAYGYATDTDRRAWLKSNDIRGWTGRESQPLDTPAKVKRRREQAKKVYREVRAQERRVSQGMSG